MLGAAALDATGELVVALDISHRIEKRFTPGSCNKRGARSAELLPTHEIGRKNLVALALFVVDVRIGRCTHNANGGLFVPACIEPVAEVLAVDDRQLDNAQRLHRRNIHAQIIVGLRTVRHQIDKFKGDITLGYLHGDFRLVHLVRKAHGKHIAVKLDRIGRIRRTLVGMDKLDLVVERAILRSGYKSDILSCANTLNAGFLDDKRLDHRIGADNQPKIIVLHNYITFGHRLENRLFLFTEQPSKLFKLGLYEQIAVGFGKARRKRFISAFRERCGTRKISAIAIDQTRNHRHSKWRILLDVGAERNERLARESCKSKRLADCERRDGDLKKFRTVHQPTRTRPRAGEREYLHESKGDFVLAPGIEKRDPLLLVLAGQIGGSLHEIDLALDGTSLNVLANIPNAHRRAGDGASHVFAHLQALHALASG